MDFNIDSLLGIIMPILVVCIGIAAVKKAIGCVITLAIILVVAFLAFSFLGNGALS